MLFMKNVFIPEAQLDSLVSIDYSGALRAKTIWLTMRPRTFGINKIVLTSFRPPYHVNGSEMSHLLAGSPKAYTIRVEHMILDIHVTVNWQLWQSADQGNMAVSRAQVFNSIRWRVF